MEPIENPRLTLEVSFYGEGVVDSGGPRREFFRLCLHEIKAKYFDRGIQEHLANDYIVVGTIMALSILQNGSMPRFLGEENIHQIFQSGNPSESIFNLRKGLDKLGLYQIRKALPSFQYLFTPSPASAISRRKLLLLLQASVSEDGSNARKDENAAYQMFTKYCQEAGSGRRGNVSLGHILQFVTGADEEPPVGFQIQPSIVFVPANDGLLWSFVLTANTCTHTLNLPRSTSGKTSLPNAKDLFSVYDTAFSNAYFGKA